MYFGLVVKLRAKQLYLCRANSSFKAEALNENHEVVQWFIINQQNHRKQIVTNSGL